MPTSATVLRQARKRLGIEEIPRNSNRTKVGVQFGWNGVPWCAEYVCVCLSDAGFKFHKTASAPGLCAELKGHGFKAIPKTKAKAGDIVFFTWPGTSSTIDHTGIVEGRTQDGRLITLEGNTTLSNGNGGVARKVRAMNCVSTIIRPPYQKPAI